MILFCRIFQCHRKTVFPIARNRSLTIISVFQNIEMQFQFLRIFFSGGLSLCKKREYESRRDSHRQKQFFPHKIYLPVKFILFPGDRLRILFRDSSVRDRIPCEAPLLRCKSARGKHKEQQPSSSARTAHDRPQKRSYVPARWNGGSR